MRIFTAITSNTIENRAALRTAIAAVTAVLLAFALHLDKPYWSGMTVVIVANLYVGSIIDKAILRIIGTVIGVWVGVILASMIANSLFLYLLINLLLISVAVYYYNFSSYAYAFLLGALGAFIVIAQLAINADQVFYVAVWRPIEIGLGVIVSAAAALCLFPNNIHENVRKNVAVIFDSLSKLLEQVRQALLTGNPTWVEISNSNLALKEKLKKSIGMIGVMRRELGVTREKVDEFRVLLDLFFELSRAVTYFETSYEAQDEVLAFETEINLVFAAIQGDLTVLKDVFLTGKSSSQSLQAKLAIERFYATIDNIKDISFEQRRSYFDIRSLLSRIHTIITSLEETLILHQRSKAPGNKLINKQQQLSSDPDIIKHSIKAGLSAILALVFWLISNWPGGLNGIISSIVISIRKDLFEMKNVSIHRMLGCFLGGGIALFPLAFFILNLYAFILILFFSVWAFSYFSFKYTKYAYIGLQANIALVICLAQEGGPPMALGPPLERFGGIIIGIVASFIVGNILWRAHPLTLLRKNIKKIYSYLVVNMEVLFAGEGSLYDLIHLFWLTRSLMESLDEYRLNPKKKVTLDEAKRNFTQLTLIQATLSHIYRGINVNDAHRTAQNVAIDVQSIEQGLIALYKEKIPATRELIKEQVEKHLAQIDLDIFYQTNSSEAVNFGEYLRALKRLLALRADLIC
ncbi:FUSC family protein [Legionella cardiaca]|uniref:FUSC family protein n=1 Tax=Legionella cardiaca TaxID=1071983 RepID=A0ABY8ANC7_9GAMM|nr:FUSC family protein [Legionella cardiaca]WED42028.1 FUSC family protein [Legionella cardiaca]